MQVAQRLQFELDDASAFDFVVLELEALFARIPCAARRYYQGVYLRPAVLLRLFQIVDHVAQDMDSAQFAPSLVASCVLHSCFLFADWRHALRLISNSNSNSDRKPVPRLSTPTPTPTPCSPTAYAKLGGQIVSEHAEDPEARSKCSQMVAKHLGVELQYWRPPTRYVFEYDKTLRNNIVSYQTWRALPRDTTL